MHFIIIKSFVFFEANQVHPFMHLSSVVGIRKIWHV
jgi:hypothetical protein